MNLEDARRMNFYEIITEDLGTVKALDTLTRRIFGCEATLIVKTNSQPKRWKVSYWATMEESEVIQKMIMEFNSQRLDEEYERLIEQEHF